MMNRKFNPFIKPGIGAVGLGLATEVLLWFWLMHIGTSACSSRNLISEIGLFSQWPGLLLFSEMVNAHTFLGSPIADSPAIDRLAPVVCFSIQVSLGSVLWWMALWISRPKNRQST